MILKSILPCPSHEQQWEQDENHSTTRRGSPYPTFSARGSAAAPWSFFTEAPGLLQTVGQKLLEQGPILCVV